MRQKSRMNGKVSSLGKDQFSNARATSALVNLDANESSLLAEPVDPAHAAAPVHVHPRAPRLEALCDFLLGAAQGLPLLWRDWRPQRRVHSVQDVEDRNRARARATPRLWRADGKAWPRPGDNDRPGELVRAKDELRGGGCGRVRRWLSQRVSGDGGVCRPVEDRACGG